MLTFLVLLPLHVATLTLFEWVTHKRGEFEKTFYRGMEKISCQTGTIDAAWSAVKDFIPNSLCSKGKDLLLYVKCWQWRCVNLHTHLQQKPISTLKHLLWKEKTCQHAPMTWIPNPHETRIWPNSRVRIWHNSACRNVCFAMAKKRFVRKTLFLRARFLVRRDDYVIVIL